MTEYRKQFMSPRREDYIPHFALPKISVNRSSSQSRSFLSHELEQEPSASEYRFRYPNHRPRRPFVCQAQPSHVFDFVPLPIDTRPRVKFDSSPSFGKDTEYHERFPNYRSFVPVQELIPPHLSSSNNALSASKQRKELMTRSQYFHELVTENDRINGDQRFVANSEQRTAFQWPYHPQHKPPSNLNFYEPIPPITRSSSLNFNQ